MRALACCVALALAGCDETAVSRASVTTRGRVIDLDCADGGAVTYAFSAGGQPYRTRTPAGAAACANARVGDTVVVAYAPDDPESNQPVISPRRRHWSLTKDGWIALCSLGLVGAMASVALRPRPKAQR